MKSVDKDRLNMCCDLAAHHDEKLTGKLYDTLAYVINYDREYREVLRPDASEMHKAFNRLKKFEMAMLVMAAEYYARELAVIVCDHLRNWEFSK